VGTVKPAEFESWIRLKSASAGPSLIQPLEIGWVDLGSWYGPFGPTIRLVNRSGDPVSGINVIFDLKVPSHPDVHWRRATFTDISLAPGESRETSVDLRNVSFYSGPRLLDRSEDQRLNWADVSALIRYRDSLGFFRTMVCELALV